MIYRLFLGCAAGVFLSGCATTQPPPPAATALSVPFFPDNTDQCGPSALASVLSFWGKATRPEELKKEIYLTQIKGTLPFDLLLAAQKRMPARMYSGNLKDVKTQLESGRPLILFLNLGYSWAPAGHYIVVVALASGGVYAHSGNLEAVFISNRDLLKAWAKTNFWTLQVGPPEAHAVP